MNTSTQNKIGVVAALINAAVLSVIIASYFLGVYSSKQETKSSKAELIIEHVVHEMPNSAFKSNLLTVLGAYYGDSSEELNEIMQMYSDMKIQEMSKGGDL